MHAKKVLTFIIKQAAFSQARFLPFSGQCLVPQQNRRDQCIWANPITSELRLNFKPLDKEFNLLITYYSPCFSVLHVMMSVRFLTRTVTTFLVNWAGTNLEIWVALTILKQFYFMVPSVKQHCLEDLIAYNNPVRISVRRCEMSCLERG